MLSRSFANSHCQLLDLGVQVPDLILIDHRRFAAAALKNARCAIQQRAFRLVDNRWIHTSTPSICFVVKISRQRILAYVSVQFPGTTSHVSYHKRAANSRPEIAEMLGMSDFVSKVPGESFRIFLEGDHFDELSSSSIVGNSCGCQNPFPYCWQAVIGLG